MSFTYHYLSEDQFLTSHVWHCILRLWCCVWDLRELSKICDVSQEKTADEVDTNVRIQNNIQNTRRKYCFTSISSGPLSKAKATLKNQILNTAPCSIANSRSRWKDFTKKEGKLIIITYKFNFIMGYTIYQWSFGFIGLSFR